MAENYFGITDTGRVRNNNEDTFIAEPVLEDHYIAGCVIDGVGGYEGGEVAAAIARETILQELRAATGDVVSQMRNALKHANEHILSEKLQVGNYKDMACVTTLALADLTHHKFYYAHVGDTRLYLLRDHTLVKVTKDHSFVGFLEDTGRLSEEAAMAHPKRNEINKALGFNTPDSFSADYIETGESPFLPGDLLLLCSDGLTDMVNSRIITAILTSGETLEQKAKALIDAANNAGGKDNITVVLLFNNAKRSRLKPMKPASATRKKKARAAAPQEIVTREQAPATEEGQAETTNTVPEQRTSNNKVFIILLSLISLVLLAVLLWQLLHKPKEKISAQPTIPKELNAQEKNIAGLLNHAKSDTLLLTEAQFPQPIVLSDTLQVQKDSVYIKGKGNIVFIADSSFEGPALVVPSTAKHVTLENIAFQNFKVALLAQDNILQLKNVRFNNCNTPVQYSFALPENQYINGKVGDKVLFKADSLPKTNLK